MTMGRAAAALRQILPAFLLLAATLPMTAVALVAPRDGGPVAVVFRPGLPLAESIVRASTAGAAVVGTGVVDSILIVRPRTADFAGRVRTAGAVVVLDADALGGCLRGPGSGAGTL
jgi:hypothetical protein